jgi:predicted ATP-dependent endonuclease of OLD family
MLTRLRIKNFKAWGDQLWESGLRLAPVTLLLGPNSAGKTSLLQVPLLLKQTFESPDRTLDLNTGGQPTLRTEPVRYDRDGYGIVPASLAAVDNSDKKFVAAALNDPANIHIVNAVDSDWQEHAAALGEHGVVVVELLP